MVELRRCSSCNHELSSVVPSGLCPRCLLRIGLDGADLGPDSDDRDAEVFGWEDGFGISAVDSLAVSVRALPEVLRPEFDSHAKPEHVVRPANSEKPPLEMQAGRIQLLGELARGGMGSIFHGRDTDLGRDVAVKIVLDAHRDRPEMIRRFIEEAQIAGQLQHPGIVPVYELGRLADKRPYFAMKLVKGRTLESLLRDRVDPTHDQPRFLAIFSQVCQTVAYAHARRVIHRDLKPSNVMVGRYGEVLVTDWGLAKVLKTGEIAAEDAVEEPEESAEAIPSRLAEANTDESRVGSVVGTPAYMAPEQAAGDSHRVGARSDVFGLGSILCEILTGIPAYSGRTGREIYRKAARAATAEAIARLESCRADNELIALARDCLADDPSQRPSDAGEVTTRLTAHAASAQARLRSAELARASAQARAEEEAERRLLADRLADEARVRAAHERAGRRLTVALAIAVIVVVVMGFGGAVFYSQQRQAQRVRIATLLHEVEVLVGDAQNDPTGDPSRWLAARTAARRASAFVDQVGEERSRARLIDWITRIEQGTTRATSDRKLVDQLEETRSTMDGSNADRVEARYAKAFNEAGFTVDTTSPAELARAFAGRPTGVVTSLMIHLDYWTHVRRLSAVRANVTERWRHPLAAARALDTDPWRNELRDAWGRNDRETYIRLAGAPDLDSRPPESLCLLGILLTGGSGSEKGLDILQRAQARYPNDFWTNVELTIAYQSCNPPRLQEAARYMAAATALRPNSAGARYRLGYILEGAGDFRAAEIALLAALRLNPTHVYTRMFLGFTHFYRGEFESAIGWFREVLRLEPDNTSARDFMGVCQLARAIKSDRVLGVLLSGETPKNANERVAVAAICAVRHEYLAAAPLYAEALKEQPSLADDRALQNRFRAAQCAARIAASKTEDESTKTRWRRQAQEWLKAELLTWSNTISTGTASDRSQAATALHHWKTTIELEAVRDPQFLNKLTEDERASWRSLWAEVDRLREIAGSKPSADGR